MADRSYNSPIGLACLACRTSKTRCDGRQPCQSCTSRNRECAYQPSRRGGRREVQHDRIQKTPGPVRETSSPLSGIYRSIGSDIETLADFSGSATISTLNHPSGTETTPATHEATSCNSNHVKLDLASPTVNCCNVRAYRSEDEIVNAYFIFIHPFIPLLPPPTTSLCTDMPATVPNVESISQLQTLLPYWPKSPLTLAMSAILVLIPHPHDKSPMDPDKVLLRRSFARLYAQASFENVERVIDNSEASAASFILKGSLQKEQSILHAHVPVCVEPVLALNLLAIYEYCQRGNKFVMRARINLAITLAMDMSLHDIDPGITEYSEGLRRTWWSTMFMLYNTSCFTSLEPVISLEDSRIKTCYPQFCVAEEPWPVLLKSVESLFAIQKMVEGIECLTDFQSYKSIFTDKFCEFNDTITSLASKSTKYLRETFKSGPEANAMQTLWIISRILIHTCRIRLHGPWATMNTPVFLDRHCGLISINTHWLLQPPASPLIPETITSSGLPCPFSTQKSTNICLSSAFAISRLFRQIPPLTPFNTQIECSERSSSISNTRVPRAPPYYPRTLPYFICCAMYSCQSLLVVLHKIRNAQATDELFKCSHLFAKFEEEANHDDAERLNDEIRTAIESLRSTLQHETVFEGTKAMNEEIHNACIAAFRTES